ncbi:MAG TPA: hypothetical protein VGS27_20725 [Candidatus Sulfotelmatobacter sp.]|nr:hypothetical protein [Candidatus Sulfotelmatobacter sp.]
MEPRRKLSPEEQAERDKEKFLLDFNSQYRNAVAEIPEKFRWVDQKIQPNSQSRLPLEEQAKLYKEITSKEKRLEGWAFFAPAGYGKTTASWLLYKYAIRENIAHALWNGKMEFTGGDSRTVLPYWPCYCWHIVLPEYLQQIQASWNDESVVRPKLIFDKFEKAKQDGFRPRLFLEEIDKIKEGSEWANNTLFTLFNAVDKHKAQLVFDTNLSKQQFMNRFGEPIARRVKENCNVREWGFQ